MSLRFTPSPSPRSTVQQIPQTTEEDIQFSPVENATPATLAVRIPVYAERMRQRTEPRPRADDLRARLLLIPKLLREAFMRPFSDFTLVKRKGRVFVVKKGADLRDADLTDADLRGADLRETNFENALLVQANLEEANLARANLKGADLREANLRKANLEGAVLNGCDLRNADVWGARVDPATLSQAKLEGALLSGNSLHR